MRKSIGFLFTSVIFIFLFNVNMGFSAYLPGTWNGFDYRGDQFTDVGMFKNSYERVTVFASDLNQFKISLGQSQARKNWSSGQTVNTWNQVVNIDNNDFSGNNNWATVDSIPNGSGYITVTSVRMPSLNTEPFGFMYTSAFPITITGVANSPAEIGYPVDITVTLSAAKCAEEDVYVIWTTNAWVNSNFTVATGSGTSYSITIPAMPVGTDGEYLAVTTTASSANLQADLHKLILYVDDNADKNYTFTVVDVPVPPVSPVLSSPTNGDLNTLNIRPLYEWTQGADPNGDPVTTFQIVVSSNADLTSPTINSNFTTTETNFMSGYKDYLKNNVTYYWAMRASDGGLWSDWSTTNTFMVTPDYVVLDESLSEWPAVTFSGTDTDLISGGQWRWSDASADVWMRTATDQNHLDLTEFAITADTNSLFFMFKVPDFTTTPQRTYISIGIDTNADGSASGTAAKMNVESSVDNAALWDIEIIASVDGTGFYDSVGTFTDWGAVIMSSTASPGFGEIAMDWDKMGLSSVPEKLRMTVDVARVVDTAGDSTPFELTGADFVDSVTTNTGGTSIELADAVNNCYFDIDFNTNGLVLENKFAVTPTTNVITVGVPFQIVVSAQTFLSGAVVDYNRAVLTSLTSNGTITVLSNTAWNNGSSTNTVMINAVGSNQILIKDSVYTNKSGTSSWFYVRRPDVVINEVGFDLVGGETDGQWIEIFNNAPYQVNLSNWTVHDHDVATGFHTIAREIYLPSSNYLVLQDGTGTDDTDFTDGKGILYKDWGSTRLGLANDEVGLYSSSNDLAQYTIIDFVAYGADAGTHDDNAVAAGIWTAADFVDLTGLQEGASIGIFPDGDDNNLSTDWDIDNTPTSQYNNEIILSSHITVVTQSSACYAGSIVLAYELVIPDPENDGLTQGDDLSNLVVLLNGTITTNDIVNASLWNANGSSQFNYGYQNNGKTNNLHMGYGAYSNTVNGFIFNNLSNNTIADTNIGGTMRLFLSLELETNATVGNTFNPLITVNSISMKSTYPAPTGPVDLSVSNGSSMSISGGRVVVNEYTDASWAGVSDYVYQFVELYNNSVNSIDPVVDGFTISTRQGEDTLSFNRGASFASGDMLLVAPGGTSIAAWLSFYDENTSAPVLVTGNDYLGSSGFVTADTPAILRAGNTIVGIVDYTNAYSSTGYTVERIDPYGADDSSNYESSSFTNGTPGYLNGFRAVEMNLQNVSNYSLNNGTSNNLVLDFYIPNNNGIADTLDMITIYNNGTAVDTDISLKLYRDGSTSGFEGDETLIGAFSYNGSSRWSWNGASAIPNTGAVSSWRFFVTADIPDTVVEGRTVRLQIEELLPANPAPYSSNFTNGIKVASFNEGPVDYVVSNISQQVCGIANLNFTKTVTNIDLNGEYKPLPGALVTFVFTYENTGTGSANNVVFYDQIPQFTSYYTNYLGTATGWTVQFSTNASPDQSYGSTDYDSNFTNANWIRWKKSSVASTEDGLTLYLGVTID